MTDYNAPSLVVLGVTALKQLQVSVVGSLGMLRSYGNRLLPDILTGYEPGRLCILVSLLYLFCIQRTYNRNDCSQSFVRMCYLLCWFPPVLSSHSVWW